MRRVDHYKMEFFSLGGDIHGEHGCPIKELGSFNKDLTGYLPSTMTRSFYNWDSFPIGSHADCSPLPYPDGIEKVDIYRAIAKGLPEIGGFTMETEANLLVSLIEIKQWMSVFSVASYAGGPLVRLASLFLAYSFAIAPTLSDLETILKMDDKLQRAIKRWNRLAGKPQYFHFKVPAKSTEFVKSTSPLVKVIQKDEFTGYGTIAVIGDRIEAPSLRIKIAQLGFDKPLSAIWELIPFSFVVDWFTDISGLISKFETKASPAKFNVYDACYSIKHKQTVVCEPTEDASDVGETLVQTRSHYHRNFLNTDYLNSPQFAKEQGSWEPSSRFGLNQAILTGALIIVLHPAFRR